MLLCHFIYMNNYRILPRPLSELTNSVFVCATRIQIFITNTSSLLRGCCDKERRRTQKLRILQSINYVIFSSSYFYLPLLLPNSLRIINSFPREIMSICTVLPNSLQHSCYAQCSQCSCRVKYVQSMLLIHLLRAII